MSDQREPIVMATEEKRPTPAGIASFFAFLATNTEEGDSNRIFWRYMAKHLAHAEVFEFGQFPDQRMRDEAVRGGELMGAGLLQPPFEASIFYYTLDIDPTAPAWVALQHEGIGATTVRYCTCVVGPVEVEVGAPVAYLCVDFMKLGPVEEQEVRQWTRSVKGGEPAQSCRLWMVAGAALIRTMEDGFWDGVLVQGEEFAKGDPGRRRSLMGSLADGIAGLSMILCTRGIPVRREEPPAKVNAKRAKSGKAQLPVVTYVDTRAYLEAADRTSRGGHHASPVPHLRRGHRRTYKDGSQTWVRSAMVNCRSREELAGRDHYTVET